MYKTLAIMLTAAFAVAALTATTTIGVQPAYSQVTHCSTGTCITPGQTPTQTTGGLTSFPSHQEAGQGIGEQKQACGQGDAECTVGKTITIPK